ncbi:hypothetical protein ACNF42_03135 [Cuniculiplasma sp. SKW3]|uniref:hypothetical protein n=1 Tax=Cuniculiplasma sp. SKW3 TaxID=3400170 RepID=UPI003FD2D487
MTYIWDRIKFERFREILSDLNENAKGKNGGSDYDPVLILKIIPLQQCYNPFNSSIMMKIRDMNPFSVFLHIPRIFPPEIMYDIPVSVYIETDRKHLIFNKIKDKAVAR